MIAVIIKAMKLMTSVAGGMLVMTAEKREHKTYLAERPMILRQNQRCESNNLAQRHQQVDTRGERLASRWYRTNQNSFSLIEIA